MKKEYEKPTLEVVTFEYDVKAENSAANIDFDASGWWG